MYAWKEMEAHSAVPAGKVKMEQLCTSGGSGVVSSSLPVLPTTVEEFPKLPDSQNILMEKQIRSDQLTSHYSPFVADNGNGQPLYPPPSGFSSDLDISSILPHERHTNGTPLVSQSLNEVHLPSAYSSYTGAFQASNCNLPRDPTEVTWLFTQLRSPPRICQCTNRKPISLNTEQLAIGQTYQKRNLQLRIEEQGKYLQMMFENQCKTTMDKLHAPSSVEEPSNISSDLTQSSAKIEFRDAGSNPVDSNKTEITQQILNKRKMPEVEPSNHKDTDAVTDSPSSAAKCARKLLFSRLPLTAFEEEKGERSDSNHSPSIEMLFQVGGQGARPTFFEMAAAQQLPASLRAALTYSLGVPRSSLAFLPSLGFFYRRVCSSMKLGFREMVSFVDWFWL
ncbi:hypothetical protein BHE74_00017182 [Ensete ventricosum]|nr:hypothetical protein BHE74_00017182 [Ensete ventricosum]